MKYMLVFVGVMVLSFGLYLSTYLGAFKDVEISQGNQIALLTVYRENTGPYHKVNKIIESVEKNMKDLGVTCGRTFGEYLDDPQNVEEARLRSRVGCVVDQVPAKLPEDLLAGSIPAGHYVTAIFTGSPGIGPLKVYPRVNEFMEKNGLKQTGPVTEIYEIHSITEKNAMTTTYLFKTDK